MSEQFQYQNDLSRKVLEENRKRKSHMHVYDGMSFVVDENVFSPATFNGWQVFTPALAQELHGEQRMLEIGCGCGITSLHLLMRKRIKSALLTDINPSAVQNAKNNIERLGLAHRASAVQSDVFDSVPKGELFDAVYWNHPWLPETEDYSYADDLERGLFDPGYFYLLKYVSGLRNHLTSSGNGYLGFGDFGDSQKLEDICDAEQVDLEKICDVAGTEIANVRFQLYKLFPKAR